MSRKALIPESWVTSDIGDAALRTLLAVAMHADKSGHSYVKNDTLAIMLKKDVRRIQSDLNKCESMGFITRKFDDHGKRFFVVNRNTCTDDAQRQGMTPIVMTENVTPCRKTSSGDDAQRQGGMTPSVTPLNNPHIGNNLFLQSTSSIKKTREGEPEMNQPTPPEVEFVSFSPTASLPSSTPRQEPPAEIKRMASELQLECWLGELQFQGIDLNDWRVRYALCEIQSKGGARTAKYAWGIFRNQPETQPEPANEPAKKNGFYKPTYEEAQKEYDDFRDFVRGLK